MFMGIAVIIIHPHLSIIRRMSANGRVHFLKFPLYMYSVIKKVATPTTFTAQYMENCEYEIMNKSSKQEGSEFHK